MTLDRYTNCVRRPNAGCEPYAGRCCGARTVCGTQLRGTIRLCRLGIGYKPRTGRKPHAGRGCHLIVSSSCQPCLRDSRTIWCWNYYPISLVDSWGRDLCSGLSESASWLSAVRNLAKQWLRNLRHLLDLFGLWLVIRLRLWAREVKIYAMALVDRSLDHWR